MATSFHCFRTSRIICAASSSYDRSKPDSTRQKLLPNWWTPIFEWPSDPDYIERSATKGDMAGPKIRPGVFTEKKAKELRKMTIETSTFHDIMYHSAIASRLASDLSERHHR